MTDEWLWYKWYLISILKYASLSLGPENDQYHARIEKDLLPQTDQGPQLLELPDRQEELEIPDRPEERQIQDRLEEL